jgi:hypothetical protein
MAAQPQFGLQVQTKIQCVAGDFAFALLGLVVAFSAAGAAAGAAFEAS